MPILAEQQGIPGPEGIVQSYIAAKNLPETVTIKQLTELFDAVGIVANVKILPAKEGSRTAIIAYYSDENAKRAVEYLDGNDSLNRAKPLEVEYFGTTGMKEVEQELEKRAQVLHGLNGYLDNALTFLQT